MELTLKNYATVLPKELILLAEKNKVRECDETEKGHFIAYVDDGKNSCDVSLTFLPNGEISAHSCDCKNGSTFCRHKAALLLNLANGKKTKKAVKAKKKESKSETILNDAELSELKEWVKSVIQKNKDIELSFIHYFSGKLQEYTPEEVTKLTNDAIKVVASNKKNVDVTQLKKLVELWTQVLEPVVQQYLGNVPGEKTFLNFHTLLEGCLTFQSKIDTTSNKVTKYVDDLLQKSLESINNLVIEEAWDMAVSYFVQYIPKGTNAVRMHYLLHLQNVIATSSEERKNKIIDLLTDLYEKSYPDEIYNGNQYTKIIFGLVEENGLFSKYYNLFTPIRYENEFNKKLIKLLIENNYLDQAKNYCIQQILNNYYEEHNVPYKKLLKTIYAALNDGQNLAKITAELFPYTFDFDDYIFIIKRLTDEEAKKWRTKIISRASNARRNRNSQANEFIFSLMDYEQSYKKMIGYIDSYTPYATILKYFEPIFQADKTGFMSILLRKTDDSWLYRESDEKDRECFPELFAIAEKLYTANYLRTVIAQSEKDRWYSTNHFVRYAKERLADKQQ